MGAWRTWFSRAHLAFVFPLNVRSCEREGSGSYLGSPEHHRVPSEYLIPEADDVHGLPGCIGNGVGTATGTDLSIAVQHERISRRGLADAVLYHSFVHNSGPDATVLIGVLLWWLEIVGPSQASDSAPQRARLSPSKTAIVPPQPWRPCCRVSMAASDAAACRRVRARHSQDEDRAEPVFFVGRCPAPASAEGCSSAGTAGVLEQRGRRRAPPLAILAPCARRDWKRPSQTATLSNLGRTCRIERPTEHKGWTVIEIPSTPDPRNAVHKRRLRSVPRLGTPPPRSRRCPPPYPRSRPPASMVLRHLRQSRQLTSQTRSCGWCSDCERPGRPGRRHTAHVSAECLALDQTSARTHAVPAARALLVTLDGSGVRTREDDDAHHQNLSTMPRLTIKFL